MKNFEEIEGVGMNTQELKIEVKTHTFNSFGYMMFKVPERVLRGIQKEVNKIEKDFSKAVPYNKKLAGNLRYEFGIDALPSEFESFILWAVQLYDGYFKYGETISVLKDNHPYHVDRPWVNFMKKYEFNPPHHHKGVFSYVIWLDVPYNIEDEIASESSINSNFNCPGHFILQYTDSLGRIMNESLPVDKKMNGVMCVFPAPMIHYVTPFYTSDEYRISVAGNVCLDEYKNV